MPLKSNLDQIMTKGKGRPLRVAHEDIHVKQRSSIATELMNDSIQNETESEREYIA